MPRLDQIGEKGESPVPVSLWCPPFPTLQWSVPQSVSNLADTWSTSDMASKRHIWQTPDRHQTWPRKGTKSRGEKGKRRDSGIILACS